MDQQCFFSVRTQKKYTFNSRFFFSSSKKHVRANIKKETIYYTLLKYNPPFLPFPSCQGYGHLGSPYRANLTENILLKLLSNAHDPCIYDNSAPPCLAHLYPLPQQIQYIVTEGVIPLVLLGEGGGLTIADSSVWHTPILSPIYIVYFDKGGNTPGPLMGGMTIAVSYSPITYCN